MAAEKEKKKIGAVRVILRVMGVILALLLLALLVMYIIPLTESVDRTEVRGSVSWMSRLGDETPLDEITMPGTHDSATKNVQLGYFSKCQALTIGEQLEAGYRYLDIRLAVDGEGMKLMHGFTNCRSGALPWDAALSLDEVLEQCYDFLKAHPTETVIFAVKQEHGEESVEQFEKALNAIIQKNADLWLLTDTIPTLGEARGRLVLMRRYEDAAGLGGEAGIPLLWANQDGYDDPTLNLAEEDNGSYTLWVQDRYEYEAGEKWDAFLSGQARARTGNGNIAIHFLSTKGNAAYGHPRSFARVLNEKLARETELSGWVVVDFASAELASHIYEQNFS